MPGFVRRVEELEVFQRAYRLSLEVHRASLDFPRIEQLALADQIRRASKSICANLAEGFGRQQQSRPEFRRFLIMAIGSADEMQVWALYCRDLGYVEAGVAERWRGEYREIAKMISGLCGGSSDD
jgi:four helix bundle protein